MRSVRPNEKKAFLCFQIVLQVNEIDAHGETPLQNGKIFANKNHE